jgi:hypothetical protein
LSSGSSRSRTTQGEDGRKKPMSTQSRRKKPAQQGPTVQDEDGLDCHEQVSTVQDEDGLDYHEEVGPDQKR